MIHLKSIEDGRSFFKALGSDIRIEIVKTLLENDHMNMNELASSLKITNGAQQPESHQGCCFFVPVLFTLLTLYYTIISRKENIS